MHSEVSFFAEVVFIGILYRPTKGYVYASRFVGTSWSAGIFVKFQSRGCQSFGSPLYGVVIEVCTITL